MNKIVRSILRFEISSLVSNAFLLTKQKLPLNEILLLAFKRVLKWVPILKSYFHKHRYQFKIFNVKFILSTS
jgi:hypothetical protein